MKFLCVKTCILLLALISLSQSVFSQSGIDRFQAYSKESFISGKDTLRFRLLSPLDGNSKKHPLVIFLHGAIGPEADNESQLYLGGNYFLRDSLRKKYPAYVVFPRCPKSEIWVNFENEIAINPFRVFNWNFNFRKGPSLGVGLLLKLIDSLLLTGNIDRDRIYILGASQGGMGVLDLLARKPDLFAAGISICGAGDVSTAKFFAGKSSLWLFHGKEDDQISPDFSQSYYNRLMRLKSDVRLSLYDNTKHDSWNKAFGEPDFLQWMFSKSKLKIQNSKF